eukprot:scaffold174744_cov28-Tisochrysis_lutea.AAC.3
MRHWENPMTSQRRSRRGKRATWRARERHASYEDTLLFERSKSEGSMVVSPEGGKSSVIIDANTATGSGTSTHKL